MDILAYFSAGFRHTWALFVDWLGHDWGWAHHDWTSHVLAMGFLATWHALWFHSTLPATVTTLCWKTLSHRVSVDFWHPNQQYGGLTRREWEEWWSGVLLSWSGWRFVLGYQLLCPWCFGFHSSWLLGALLTLITGAGQYVVGGCTFYPIVVFIASRLAK